ncbi:uncharacterized protein LOC112546643 [Pelodiscus sinensis]|uniref:uncharacterized protein LOC112546643 n=1 Tax=Pelodiscus sinensis TaxID=13735 RepID=UPI003F6C457B
MGISGKFLNLWRNHFTVISTSVYSLVLVVLEHSMDPNFKCPEDKKWRRDYSLCYILIPPFALFLVGMVVQTPSKCCEYYMCCRGKASWIKLTDDKKKNCKRISTICLKALVPAGLWIIIMLLDGKYFDCLCTSPQVNGTADNAQPAMSPYHISQMVGLGFVGCIALGGFIYWCRKCCRERVTMNVFQSRERLRVQAADYLDEQQNEAIRKLIEKHLNKRYIAAPATFVTGLSDANVSFEIRRALNVLWENQGPAGGAQSGAIVVQSAAGRAESAADGARSTGGGGGGRAESAGARAESSEDEADSAATEGTRLQEFPS